MSALLDHPNILITNPTTLMKLRELNGYNTHVIPYRLVMIKINCDYCGAADKVYMLEVSQTCGHFDKYGVLYCDKHYNNAVYDVELFKKQHNIMKMTNEMLIKANISNPIKVRRNPSRTNPTEWIDPTWNINLNADFCKYNDEFMIGVSSGQLSKTCTLDELCKLNGWDKQHVMMVFSENI